MYLSMWNVLYALCQMLEITASYLTQHKKHKSK